MADLGQVTIVGTITASDYVLVVTGGKAKRVPASQFFAENGYQGIAALTTNPTTPSRGDWYYCDEDGTYTNFGAQAATKNDRFYYNGTTWDLIAFTNLIEAGWKGVVSPTSPAIANPENSWFVRCGSNGVYVNFSNKTCNANDLLIYNSAISEWQVSPGNESFYVFAQDVNAAGFGIKNVKDAVDPGDVVPKSQVESMVANHVVNKENFDSYLQADLGGTQTNENGTLVYTLSKLGTNTTWFNHEPASQSGTVKQISIYIGTIGDIIFKVLKQNPDGTYSTVREFTQTFAATGLNVLNEGTDYARFIIEEGYYLAIYNSTGLVNYGYLADHTSRTYAGNAGENVTFTSASALVSMSYILSSIGSVQTDLATAKTDITTINNDLETRYISRSQILSKLLEVENPVTGSNEASKSGVLDYDKSVQEVVNEKNGRLIAPEKINLFGANYDFENGTTGWNIGGVGADISVTSSTEQFFTGSKSLKMYGGTDASGYVAFGKVITLGAGKHSIAFAVYSPNLMPVSSDVYFTVNSSSPTINATHAYPTYKKGWWWLVYSFTSDEVARTFGFRVGKNKTYYVDSAMIVKTDGLAMRFINGTKIADQLNISTSVNGLFTFGFLAKASQIYSSNSAELTTLATLNSSSGDKFQVTFNKTTSKFIATKTVSGIPVSVESNAVKFNADAVIGVAIQQTADYFKLFIVSPRAIVFDFDDGRQSVYDNAFPIMEKAGIKGTTHVITNEVQGVNPNYMHLASLKELKSKGWTIDSHTMSHAHLSALDEAGQLAEIKGSQDYLKSKGFDYDLIATPYGEFNDTTLMLFDKVNIKLHRGYSSLGYGSENYPIKNRFKIPSDPVGNTETAAATIIRVDDRMNNYKYMHLTFHGVDIGSDSINYDPTKLQEVVDHIVENNYPCYTYAEISDALLNNKVIGNVEEFEVETTEFIDVNEIFVGSDESNTNHFDAVYSDVFLTKDRIGRKELASLWNCKY